MEKDDELKGIGNSYDFGARMFDPRVGRFFKIDPDFKNYPQWSPYVFAFNNPIRLIDVNGEAPGDPLHHEFLITVAIKIYDQAKAKGASGKGAILIIAQASLESGYGQSARRRGDYNLFGVSTNGNDYKAKNDQIKIKDYSNIGGYDAAIKDYFSKKLNKWSGIAELIKKNDFNADDINKAFYTGKYIEGQKARNKSGHYSYNFDDVTLDSKGEILTNNNEYGEDLINQMSSVSKRLIQSIDYQVDINNKEIFKLKEQISVGQFDSTSLSIMQAQIKDKETQNEKLLAVKKDIQ